MIALQANVVESGGFWVKVKLTLPCMVRVFQEASPFLQIGAFCFDEIGEVRRNHGDYVLDVHLINQLREK